MRKGAFTLIVIILVAAVAVLAYFLGRKNADVQVEHIATNNTIITQIAELSSLEVQGIATIKSTNLLHDGSLTDQLRKLLVENTTHVSVPYIAKYGVNLDKQQIRLKEQHKTVDIYLPRPGLLSYELRLDKVDASVRKGWLLQASEAQFSQIQKRLYTASKAQLAQNQVYQKQCEDKIRTLIMEYYRPLNYTVHIHFETGNQLIHSMD